MGADPAPGLTREEIVGVVAAVARSAPTDDYRIVGTAASVLDGIAVVAQDVDVLVRTRSDLDEWVANLRTIARIDTPPGFIAATAQYFARVTLDGVVVELSTVEAPADGDAAECRGAGPWAHAHGVTLGDVSVPVVAGELRLVTEVVRDRPERYEPIIRHLRRAGADAELVARGLRAAGVNEARVRTVLTALSRAEPPAEPGTRPRVEATSVSISTPAPRRLADFYAQLLGVEVAASEGPRSGEPADAGWAQLRPTAGRLVMTINFEWDPDFVRPTWPSTRDRQQPQAHLDVWVDDLDDAESWAVRAGATRHPHQSQDGVRVMLDPDGHPFCLFVDH